MQNKWWMRLCTALLWALTAFTAVYWGLRLGGHSPLPVPPAAAQDPDGDSAARQASLAKFLGATNFVATTQANTPAVSRFVLVGVVSEGRHGVALLAVDGKPPKPYRVGSPIDDATVLQSVGPRSVALAASAEGPVLQRLELPGPRHADAPVSSPLSPTLPLIPGVSPAAAAAMLPLAQQGVFRPDSGETAGTPDCRFPPQRGSPACRERP